MKKLFCILMCMTSLGRVHADVNSEYVKIGVGATLTLGGVFGAGYCIYKINQLDKLINQGGYIAEELRASQSRYILAALVCGSLTTASGVYTADQIYGLYKSYKKPGKPESGKQPDNSNFEKKKESFLKKFANKSDITLLDKFKTELPVDVINKEIEATDLSSEDKLKMKKEILKVWKASDVKDWKHAGTYLDVKRQTLEHVIAELNDIVEKDEQHNKDLLEKRKQEEELVLLKKKEEEKLERLKKVNEEFELLKVKSLAETEQKDRRFLCKNVNDLKDLGLMEIGIIKFVKTILKDTISDAEKINKIATAIRLPEVPKDQTIYIERAKRILLWYKNPQA